MRGAACALLQSCLVLLVRADQRRLEESGNCDLNRKQSELNSFLWTVKRDPPAYFYGTVHVPYTRVWDFIPENSKQAFQQSHVVYFELDLTDPRTISGLSSCQLLPQGETLQDVLPRDLYRRLKRHLDYVKLVMPSWMTPEQRGKGLYADYLFNAIAGNWERKRPVWVMLMVNSLTEADIRTRGVPVLDLYLAQEAERMRKRTGAVEKVEEQCHPLNRLNLSQVVFALNQTLLHQESLRAGGLKVPYTTEDLIRHYNCGDLTSIIFNHDSSQVPRFSNVTLLPSEQLTAQQLDGYFRLELIYKRNQRMGLRVQALLEDNPDKSFFFAFGAGHFLGNHTVIDVLRHQGYEVEHTPAGQPVDGASPTQVLWDLDRAPALEPFLRHFPNKEEALGRPLEDGVLPHMLLPPGGLDLLLKAEQKLQKKKRDRQKKQRHFNDLWARMDSSKPQSPPVVRTISGYTTVQSPDRGHAPCGYRHVCSSSSSSSPGSLVFLCTVLTVQLTMS